MLIDISTKRRVSDTLCNRCMECTDAEGGCPVEGACTIGVLGEKRSKEAAE